MANPLPAYDVDDSGDAENPFAAPGEPGGYDGYDEPVIEAPSAPAASSNRRPSGPASRPAAAAQQPQRRQQQGPPATTCWSRDWWRQNNPFDKVDALLPAEQATWYKYMMYGAMVQVALCLAAIANCARGYQWGHLSNLLICAFPFCNILAWGVFFAVACVVLGCVNIVAMIVGCIDDCPGAAVSTSLLLLASNVVMFYFTINYDPKVMPTLKYFATYACVCCGCMKPPANPRQLPQQPRYVG